MKKSLSPSNPPFKKQRIFDWFTMCVEEQIANKKAMDGIVFLRTQRHIHGFLLYNENHRKSRWFPKAFALHNSRRSGGSLV